MQPRFIDLLDPSLDELKKAAPPHCHHAALDRAVRRHDDPTDVRPRIHSHGTYVYATFQSPLPAKPDGLVTFQELHTFIATDRFVLVRKTPRNGPAFDTAHLATVALANGNDPGMALSILLDLIAEQFLDVVDSLVDEIDELEDTIEDSGAKEVAADFSTLRHQISLLRRSLAPTRDAARSVVDGRIDVADETLFPHEIEIHFADSYDKLLRATDGLEITRDLLGGVRDFHQSTIANEQNEVMKRLTVISSVLLVPTFIVGMYGQNFLNMPELNWRFGYGFSWMLIVLSTVAQLAYYRWKRWF